MQRFRASLHDGFFALRAFFSVGLNDNEVVAMLLFVYAGIVIAILMWKK